MSSTIIHTPEFIETMSACLFEVADLAIAKQKTSVIQNKHENIRETNSERKKRVGIVSSVDLEIQEILLQTLYKHWPFVTVMAEESTSSAAKFEQDSHFCVLLDPIDGTQPYLNQENRFCHIISLMEGGQMLLSMVYSHYYEKLYLAIRDQGSYSLNREGELESIQLKRANNKIIFHHVSRIPETLITNLRSNDYDLRESSQNATDILSMLHEKAEAFISLQPVVYDVWSPGMIIQEAGGFMSDWNLNPLIYKNQQRVEHALISSAVNISQDLASYLYQVIES